MKIIVIGGYGSVGSGIVKILARLPEVEQLVVAGRNPRRGKDLVESLPHKHAAFRFWDLDDSEDVSGKDNGKLGGFDIAINATYAHYNLKLMRRALEGGCHYLDLGGMFHTTAEQLKLDPEFRAAGLTAILCMGACPGASNILAAHGAEKLERCDEVRIRVGSKRGADFSGFNMSPQTLIAEFTRNPYVYENGEWRMLEPLSGRERFRLPEPIEEVEGFYCIHSEVLTLPKSIPGVQRVTYQVSFPAAVMNMMDVLLDLKLLDPEPFSIAGASVSPRAFLESYLGSTIKTVTGYREEFKALQVEVRGLKEGRQTSLIYEMVAASNRELDLLSSAYWTSVPHTIAVAMLGEGRITKRGVFPPETAVDPALFLEQLKNRGLDVREREA